MKNFIKSLIHQARYIRYEFYKTLEQTGDLEEKPIGFIIFTGARSGSNLLCNILNSHPEILCHYELFNSQKIYYSQDICDRAIIHALEERDRNIELFLAKIWQHNFDCAAVGFKIFRHQNPIAIDLLIKDKQVRKILLVRKNQIKSYVSWLIAQNNKKWCNDTKNGSQQQENQQVYVKVNIESLHNWIRAHNRYYEQLRQKLRKSKQSFLEITYEDLIGANNELVKSNILQFIGVSAQPHILQTTLKKQNSDNLVDLVSNFGELEEKLHGTELAPLLYS